MTLALPPEQITIPAWRSRIARVVGTLAYRRLTGSARQTEGMKMLVRAGKRYVGEDGCTTDREFAVWGEMWLATKFVVPGESHDPGVTFCADCALAFRAQMTEEGRCWKARQAKDNVE